LAASGTSSLPLQACGRSNGVGGEGVVFQADRERVSHASSARAGRSRERQSKWAGPRVVH